MKLRSLPHLLYLAFIDNCTYKNLPEWATFNHRLVDLPEDCPEATAFRLLFWTLFLSTLQMAARFAVASHFTTTAYIAHHEYLLTIVEDGQRADSSFHRCIALMHISALNMLVQLYGRPVAVLKPVFEQVYRLVVTHWNFFWAQNRKLRKQKFEVKKPFSKKCTFGHLKHYYEVVWALFTGLGITTTKKSLFWPPISRRSVGQIVLLQAVVMGTKSAFFFCESMLLQNLLTF